MTSIIGGVTAVSNPDCPVDRHCHRVEHCVIGCSGDVKQIETGKTEYGRNADVLNDVLGFLSGAPGANVLKLG